MERIFLYTKDAELTDHAKAQLRKAGYIPIKVKEFSSVQFYDPPPKLPAAETSEILRAALDALIGVGADSPHRYSWERFTKSLGSRLLSTDDKDI